MTLFITAMNISGTHKVSISRQPRALSDTEEGRLALARHIEPKIASP